MWKLSGGSQLASSLTVWSYSKKAMILQIKLFGIDSPLPREDL